MSDIENLLKALLEKMTEVGSTLNDISEKINDLSSGSNLSEIVQSINDLDSSVRGDTHSTLSDIQMELTMLNQEVLEIKPLLVK